jgi:raffinose/stachyose/melibiose transport system substrate-binding protein
MRTKNVLYLPVIVLLVISMTGCSGATPTVVAEPEPTIAAQEPIEAEVPASPETQAPPEQEPELTEEPVVAESITLDVWFISQSPEGSEIIKSIGEKFSDKYPNVTVKFSFYTFEDMNRSLRLALDGGIGPDVANATSGLAGTDAYARAGHLVDLTEMAEERGWVDHFGQDLLSFANLFAPEQRTYGIPTGSSTVGVYYNTEIFDQLGLEEPNTFEEFENILKTLKENGITPIAVGALDQWPLSHVWEQLTHVNVPIEEITLAFTLDPAANYERQEYIEATMKLQEWAEKGYFQDNFLATNFADGNSLFITGETAMNIGGTWVMHDFTTQPEFEVRFFPMPRMNPDLDWHAGGQAPENNWIIPKYAKNMDMAINFLDYIFSEEVAQMMWANGELLNFKFDTLPEPTTILQGEIYDSMQMTGPGYYPMVTGELLQAEGTLLQQVVAGDITPQDAMAELQIVYLESVAKEGR